MFKALLTSRDRFVEDDMPIRIRCLDKLPETCNTVITKEMLPHKASLRCDIIRAKKRDSATYADRSDIC